MINIFVYGTLLTGERNHHIVAPYLLQVEPGTVYGRLYDAAAGRYPALILDPNAELIEGEWMRVTAEGLSKLDELEGYLGPDHPDNLYERIRVCDASTGQQGQAYVWQHHQGCPMIPCGSWRKYKRKR
ncbi:gamma-glutamylcyclotransferase [Tumebacillus algifaecis]|uniref:Gamma-glutamylcyclotransferase n=1 Tax=Tumebacillus algifaecis TaxID=1214604 RepID=A0A223D1F0_9BACL|nr:gamma-glutamylcyclotransferase family protein [Tumebacillus algifaecis]ASS75579.1 gamma-glutamylcyclotransferase [Tumebacillus algifaecis]